MLFQYKGVRNIIYSTQKGNPSKINYIDCRSSQFKNLVNLKNNS